MLAPNFEKGDNDMDTNRDNGGYIISVQNLIEDAASRSDANYDNIAYQDAKDPPIKELT